MPQNNEMMRLTLLGPFRLESSKGARIEIRSKRGQALLAMLATSSGGDHTRGWLQERLWSSRLPEQANASLRRELSNLRKSLNTADYQLLNSDNGRVWLDLDLLQIDVGQTDLISKQEFLEGIDLPGEELFEEWLREERSALADRQGDYPEKQPSQVIEPAQMNGGQSHFSERPAIAVLPFSFTGDALELEQMAQGLSEDLIDCLSRLRWLPVIARSSSFALDDARNDPQSAGRALGARYIVDGKLREENGNTLLIATLSDAQSGQSKWSNKMELPAQNDGVAIETLLTEITSALGMQIDLQEQIQAQRKQQSDLNVNELIWRGRWHLNKLTKQDSEIARQCFEQALQQEPSSPEAQIQIAWIHIWDLWLQRGDEDNIRHARKLAQKAIIADYDDARGHMLAGIAEVWLKQPLRAEALLRRAIELNPSLAMAHVQLSGALHLRGEHANAILALKTAIRLSPNDHDLFFTLGELAVTHLFLHKWGEALDYAEQSLALRSSYWLPHVTKIKALNMLDREEEAADARAELLRMQPDFTIEYIKWLPFIDSSKHDFLIAGLNLSNGANDQ